MEKRVQISLLLFPKSTPPIVLHNMYQQITFFLEPACGANTLNNTPKNG